MRPSFSLTSQALEREARITFLYTSPELNQNIEVSINGDDDTSVEAILDSFHRFLNALGVNTPDDVVLGFVRVEDDENNKEE